MKRLAILTVLFVSLGAFVYFYEIAGREARDRARDLKESVFQLDREEISRVEIRVRAQTPVVLQKEIDTWMLRQPLETVADRNSVDSLLRGIADSRRERVFGVEGLDLEQYGLVDPEMVLRLWSGEAERTLLIGHEDFSGTQQYVRLEGDEEIILTSTRLFNSAVKDVADWRSKRVIDFDRARTESLQIRRDGEEIELVQRDDRWYVRDPFEEKADQGTVSSLLSALDLARAEEFVDEDPRSLVGYGLDRPGIVVRLRERGSDIWRHLEIGRKEGETYFARDPQRTAVFTVTQDLVDDLTLDPWAFRDKEVVDVRQDEIALLRIDRGVEEIVLRHENFRWIVESPDDLMDREAYSYRFWYPIDDLEFTELLEGGEIESPEVEMTLGLKDGTERRYRFGRSAGRCLAQQVESGRIGTLSDEDCDRLRFDIREIVGPE
jgi:hypothetical protein